MNPVREQDRTQVLGRVQVTTSTAPVTVTTVTKAPSALASRQEIYRPEMPGLRCRGGATDRTRLEG